MIDGIHFIDIFAIAITAFNALASRQNFCENVVIPQSDASHEYLGGVQLNKLFIFGLNHIFIFHFLGKPRTPFALELKN